MGHTYDIDGRFLPSVTTILDATMPHDQRVRLDRHYATKPGALLKNAESQRRGEQIDRWAKAFLLKEPLPEIDHQFAGFTRQLLPMLQFMQQSAGAIMSDRLVYDAVRGYAGTLDLAVAIDGGVIVCDIKTKDRIYEPAFHQAKLQCIAYAEALMLEGYPVMAIAVIMVSRKQLVTARVGDEDELKQLSDEWAERLLMFGGCGA